MESTVDKFDLRKHMHFGIECVSATWKDQGFWEVRLRDILTKIEYTRTADVFVSAVGGISHPRDVKFPGLEKFQGEVFHTARWNHSFDYREKCMAIIGNGCSAAQVVPAVAKAAAFVNQYARSPQWYHERPNRNFTALEKWCLKHIPLWERYLRLRLFLANDGLVATYGSGSAASKLRAKAEDHAWKYILSQAPQKYHQFLIPDFPLGMPKKFNDSRHFFPADQV
jgi:cation diffusion facilitator CzcD-associated flavoprotein CzcO